MIVFRLARVAFKNDISGRGAELAGGRWNSKGIPLLYTAESRALSALEVAVHVQLNVVPEDYLMISIELPNLPAHELPVKGLPPLWKSFPGIPETQTIGDRFCRESKYLALRVPSAIVEGDYNILINPLHTDFRRVKIISAIPFAFDQRLFIKQITA